MKRLISCIAAVVLLLVFFTGATDTVAVSSYVNDYADVISAKDEDAMTLQALQLEQKTKAQVVVVTVNSLGGQSVEDYAYNLANGAQLGDKDLDNGILLLLAVEDREVRIEVGRGLEGAIPDGKSGRILDTYGIPYFAENKFSTGVISTFDAIINEVYIEFGAQPDPNYTPVGEDSGANTVESVFSIIMFVLLLVIFFSGGRRGRIWFLPFFFGGWGGRGGFGGHGGFSGRSGGGFGGFSGGGGSFGGGGSSRRF